MEDLSSQYLSVCAEVQKPPKASVINILGDNKRSVSYLNLSGSELEDGDRLTDDDLMILSKALEGKSTIKGLDLRYNRITDKGAVYIADLIQDESLQALDLMCNDIEEEGADVIANVLLENTTLKSLRIAGNKIRNNGGMRLASMLRINSTLEDLDVSDCDLATQSVIAFAIVLKKNRSIRAINMSRPLLFSLQEETSVHIAQMLVVNKTLKELHMGKHNMTDTGVERLCEALRFNSSLRYLDLRCNRITRDGAKELSKVLKANPCLEILDLSSNRIEDDGAMYLSEAIKLPNGKLKALSITSNNIGNAGLLALYESIGVSTCLTHIYIWGNKLEEPVCVAFAELLRSRRLLKEHTDVSPYEVDGQVFLAEVSQGLSRHYCLASTFGVEKDSRNSALVLMALDSPSLQFH